MRRPYFEDSKNGIVIYHGDSREILPELPACDACVTDPPYELGFMGKKWDSTGIAYSVELWQKVLACLKPGAHLLSFGGTRTYHRMACAIEDAGFQVRDMMQWIYGSGFPKSLDVSKAIDREAGAEREVIGKSRGITGAATRNHSGIHSDDNYEWPSAKDGTFNLTAPATPEAQRWNGWGTALKPANEPICLARKPLSESSVAKNVLHHGAGGLNIDAGRIGTETVGWGGNGSNGYSGGLESNESGGRPVSGRWPSNVLLDEAAAAQLDEMSGITAAGAIPAIRNVSHFNSVNKQTGDGTRYEYDSGGASRFFYTAKASRSERNRGLENTRGIFAPTMGNGIGGKEHDPATATPKQNFHPTVKPVDLMAYLIRLVTPPGGIVLDPFAGSGTTGVAAKAMGFPCILIEQEEKHCEIIVHRLKAVHPLFDESQPETGNLFEERELAHGLMQDGTL